MNDINKISQIVYDFNHNGDKVYNLQQNNIAPIRYLEVRSIPGTCFTLNYLSGDNINNTQESIDIVLDHSGVYKLYCENMTLNEIIFKEKSLNIIDTMTPRGYLIITIT